ncbi:MAG: diguanylate cyclase [Candidatus Eremiobacteraeota bacterium]|nr:diguanylate cyclase [Candidatus Eremiobacteraeota bacterium]
MQDGSDRLRLFLIGTRLGGVVLGLSLTQMHKIHPALPEALNPHVNLLTVAILFYQLLGCVLSHFARGPVAGILVLSDTVIGFALGRIFGAPYLLLGFTLPVLEAAVFFSASAGLFLAMIGGVFYAAVLALPLLSSMRDASDQTAQASLQLIGVQGVFSFILLYLCSLTLGETRQRAQFVEEMHQEKDLLYQEMQKKTQDIGKIYAEVGQRETVATELENRLKRAEREKIELEDQLLQAVEDLDRLKLASEHIGQASEQREGQMSQELKRYKSQAEREMFLMQKRLERESRLLLVLRDLTGTLALNDTLLALTNQLQTVLPSQSCVIFLVDEVDGQRELYPEVAASPYTDAFRNRILQMGEEAPGWCVARVRPLRIENGSVAVEGTTLSTLTPYEKSALICPLKAGQDVLGAIYLGRTDANEFSPEEQDLLLRICELAGSALGNSLEYQRHIQRGLHDPVTHLYNSLYLEERLKEEVMRGRRYTYPVSLILLDLDGFVSALEKIGEAAAHKILVDVAEIVRVATRETDVPCRIENDDFGILCVHTDRDRAKAVGERIRAAVASTVFGPPAIPVKLTASVGVAGVPHDATNEEMLQKRALDALETARTGGGNRVCFWDG